MARIDHIADPMPVLPTIRRCDARGLRDGERGLLATSDPHCPGEEGDRRSSCHFRINQGPMLRLVENHLRGPPRALTHGCRPLVDGPRRADFTGGWLELA